MPPERIFPKIEGTPRLMFIFKDIYVLSHWSINLSAEISCQMRTLVANINIYSMLAMFSHKIASKYLHFLYFKTLLRRILVTKYSQQERKVFSNHFFQMLPQYLAYFLIREKPEKTYFDKTYHSKWQWSNQRQLNSWWTKFQRIEFFQRMINFTGR